MAERLTIIDFTERSVKRFPQNTFLREKVNGIWTETTFQQTRDAGRQLAAGFMALGMQKGDKAALLSEGRNLWVISELGILYAGGVNVPLSIKLEESNDLLFRIRHSDSKSDYRPLPQYPLQASRFLLLEQGFYYIAALQHDYNCR